MIYLHNPSEKDAKGRNLGSDIKDFVAGEPGSSRKYTILRGETWGFPDEIAEIIIRVYGVTDGEKRGFPVGFLRVVEGGIEKKTIEKETKVITGPVLEEIKAEDGSKSYKCSMCEFQKNFKLPVLGHMARVHPHEETVREEVVVAGKEYKVQEGGAIVPPAEGDRLRKSRQEETSMRPRRSLIDLQPKGEEEVGYRRRGIDNRDTGLDTRPDMASHFYGPGLQEDRV